MPELQSAKEQVKCSDYLLKGEIVPSLGRGMISRTMLTDGWGDDGQVLARRNPPAKHCQQKNEYDF